MRCWSIPMRWWSGSRARITGDAWRRGGAVRGGVVAAGEFQLSAGGAGMRLEAVVRAVPVQWRRRRDEAKQGAAAGGAELAPVVDGALPGAHSAVREPSAGGACGAAAF